MKTKINEVSQKLLSFIRSDGTKSSGHKFKSASFAIILGFVIGAIPILAEGGNVFSGYFNLLAAPFKKFSIQKTIVLISVYSLLGAGIGISFKTGLFNIGASGQMLLAGGFTTMMGIDLSMAKGISIPLMLLISALVGGFASSIAGALKAYFNVHEVVSTILLNWIFFYFMKFIFNFDRYKSESTTSSKSINESMKFNTALKSSETYIVLFIVIAIVILVFILFKFTTLGYQMKANGLNPNAAKYAGINSKSITIISMSLSGALAGMAGFIYYSTIKGQMDNLDHSLPDIGFKAITVTLLSFSSPIGSLAAGAFYAVVDTGIVSAAPKAGVSPETINLVLGFIILFASLSPVLIHVKPIRWLWVYNFKRKNPAYIKKHKNLLSKIKTIKNAYAKKRKVFVENKKNDQNQYKDLMSAYKQSNPTEYKDLVRKEIFKVNNKTYKLKYLQNDWSSELHTINDQQKNGEITFVEKGQKIIDINCKYDNIFKEEKFIFLKEIKNLSQHDIKELKSQDKLLLLNLLIDHDSKSKKEKEKKSFLRMKGAK